MLGVEGCSPLLVKPSRHCSSIRIRPVDRSKWTGGQADAFTRAKGPVAAEGTPSCGLAGNAAASAGRGTDALAGDDAKAWASPVVAA